MSTAAGSIPAIAAQPPVPVVEAGHVGRANIALHPSELATALCDAVKREDALNAFLLACGLSQVVDDHLHPNPLMAANVADKLAECGRPRPAALAGGLAGAAGAVRGTGASGRRVRAWKHDVDVLVAAGARLVEAGTGSLDALAPITARVAAAVETLPKTLRDAVARLPAGFQAFDLRPADIHALAEMFAARHANRARPLLVAGVRTSGSYFGPLCTAALRALGYGCVAPLTIRPGFPLDRRERALVRATAERDGLILVIDDPPGSGGSLERSAEMICRIGPRRNAVIILAPVFGDGAEPPPRLTGWETILLPQPVWAIQTLLAPAALAQTLKDFLAPEAASLRVDALPLTAEAVDRGHARAVFRVSADGNPAWRLIAAEGAGLGYFGEQALAVARALPEHVPAVHGLRDGIMVRDWLSEDRRAASCDRRLAAAVARYVDDRSARLPVAGDRSLAERGRDPAWEVAAGIVARAYGRAWPLARLVAVDRAVKLLLRPRRISVIDGNASVRQWFAGGEDDDAFVKVGFSDRSFWHFGLACHDPVFDLAGVDPGGLDESVAAELRASYEQRSGDHVDPERWLLYQFAHLWAERRLRPGDRFAIERRFSRVVRDYVVEALLSDVEPPGDGPLCALDIDGVLETTALGFPAPTAASALALRALARHGYRAVLVSGRSGADVADRRAAYRLVGAVGEYGAIVHAGADAEEHLLDRHELAALDSVRVFLTGLEEVSLHPGYQRSVRAIAGVDGHMRDLGQPLIREALHQAPSGLLAAVAGEGQTDFRAARVDKAAGLGRLAQALDGNGHGIALAVGDSVSDLPMFALARLALAPANADPHVRRGSVEVLKRPYQAGLALAVARLIGHPPGTCSLCRAPVLPARTKLLLSVLSAQERGDLGIVTSLARLAWSVRVR